MSATRISTALTASIPTQLHRLSKVNARADPSEVKVCRATLVSKFLINIHMLPDIGVRFNKYSCHLTLVPDMCLKGKGLVRTSQFCMESTLMTPSGPPNAANGPSPNPERGRNSTLQRRDTKPLDGCQNHRIFESTIHMRHAKISAF